MKKSEVIVYETSSSTEGYVENNYLNYVPYNEVELIRMRSVLDVFILGFQTWVVANKSHDGSIDYIALEKYICNFLQNDLPYFLRMRVNLDEVSDYFRLKKWSIYLVAMPRFTFQSFRDYGFILDKNGQDMPYGLSVLFDESGLNYSFNKASLDERTNRLKLRECGFYIPIPVS